MQSLASSRPSLFLPLLLLIQTTSSVSQGYAPSSSAVSPSRKSALIVPTIFGGDDDSDSLALDTSTVQRGVNISIQACRVNGQESPQDWVAITLSGVSVSLLAYSLH